MFPTWLLSILSIYHLTYAIPLRKALPSGELDYPSNEDSTYQPPSDGSISAWKDTEVWSEQESDTNSDESSTDAPYNGVDDVKSSEIFSHEKEQPTKQKKPGASVLQQVADKADRFSRNLEKVVGIADKKMTDWSRRIIQFRFHLLGPGRQGGMNGYGNGGGYGNNWNGGGGYMNGNGGNQVSLMGAYKTIWPFIKEIGSVLNKVLMYSSKLAAELFAIPPAPPRRSVRPRGPAGSRWPARSSRYKARKSPRYQYRGRGRGRGGAGAARRTRATTVLMRKTEDALPAYADQEYSDESN